MMKKNILVVTVGRLDWNIWKPILEIIKKNQLINFKILATGMHFEKKYGNTRYTSKASDWEVYLSLQADNYAHAIRLERRIKSMKSRKYLHNLKQYSELRTKIWNETENI